MHRNLISSYKGHSVSNIVCQLMKNYWCSMMEISEENLCITNLLIWKKDEKIWISDGNFDRSPACFIVCKQKIVSIE